MHTIHYSSPSHISSPDRVSARVKTSLVATTLAISQVLAGCVSVPNVYSSAPMTREQVTRTYDPRTGTMNTQVQSSRRRETYYRDQGVRCVENTRITTRNGQEERSTTSVHCTPVRGRQSTVIRLW